MFSAFVDVLPSSLLETNFQVAMLHRINCWKGKNEEKQNDNKGVTVTQEEEAGNVIIVSDISEWLVAEMNGECDDDIVEWLEMPTMVDEDIVQDLSLIHI